MRILVLSDIHNRGSVAEKIIAAHDDIKDIFFLGDGIDHIDDLACFFPDRKFYTVSGNCDFSSSQPAVASVCLCGKQILYTHGHPYSVKWSLARLKADAESRGADLVLYGHTHTAKVEYEDCRYYVNPGAVCGSPASYAVVDLSDAGIMPNIINI